MPLNNAALFPHPTQPATRCDQQTPRTPGARAWPGTLLLLLGLLLTHIAAPAWAADVRISEFMAVNVSGIKDEDGDFSDWIEIHNAGLSAVSLAGWFLTDTTNNLTQWRFPDVTLLPNSYLLVFASEKNKTNVLGQLHTNFKLNSSGEYLGLLDAQTNVVSEYAPKFPTQRGNVSFGRDQAEPDLVGYMVSPTPGSANSSSGEGFSPEVKFSRNSGHFTEPFQLSLSVPAGYSNIVIRYTLNGTVPSAASAIYTNTITITNSVLVRARAFETNQLPGPIHSEAYIRMSTNVLEVSSDLPIVLIHTFSAPFPDTTTYQASYLEIIEPNGGRTFLTNAPSLATRVGIQNHGSSTAGQAKHNVRVEFWDELNDDKKLSPLGLPSDSDFLLYAPNNFEPVEIHNTFMYGLSRDIGRYASRTRFVEVYLNLAGGQITPADYNGLYVLMEVIKLTKDRVSEPSLKPTDIAAPDVTGGYLLKVDRSAPGDQGEVAGGQVIQYDDPPEISIKSAQRAPQHQYITNYINDFGVALNGTSFTNPVTGYAQYMDVDSWVDHSILNVLAFNVDALRLSTYFYKARNGKLTFGPIWDFDRALGSTDGRDSDPRIWSQQTPNTEFFTFGTQQWWGRLFQDVNFWQKWIDRWQELRRDQLSSPNVNKRIDIDVAQIRESVARDHIRWSGFINPRGGFTGEVASMKGWLSNRIDFIDGQLQTPARLSSPGGPIQAGFPISLSTTGAGTIYYTLDGTDPRLPGGGVAPNAKAYSGTFNLSQNARVVARVLDPNHRNLTGGVNPPVSSPWSGPVAGTYVVRTPTLTITEIMYHPEAPAAGSTNSAGDFEFVEFLNTGDAPLDLSGFKLTGTIQYDFTQSAIHTLGPGERVVIVKDVAAFQARYPAVTQIAGAYAGALGNSGGHLQLEGPLREPILDFSYDAAWLPITDGFGFSLVVVDPHAPLDSWGSPNSWRISGGVGGSPGAGDLPAPPQPPVLVNEVLTHTAVGTLDAVELYNPTDVDANIGGWFLTDNYSTPRKYRIPDGKVIPARGYLTFTEDDFNRNVIPSRSFAFSSRGEDVYLFSGNASQELSGYLHGFSFGPAELMVSFGRHVDSQGVQHFVAQATNSLGATNSLPRVGPVVISEIAYHPPDLVVAGYFQDNVRREFIELKNITSSAVPLFDPAFPTNTWQLDHAVRYTFPTNTSLPAGGYAIVVSFDPLDPVQAADFRSAYAVPDSVPLFGPYEGKLANDSDRVQLLHPRPPEVPSAAGDPAVVYFLVDEIQYKDAAPWPVAADGIGPSLHRVNSETFGNDPANWVAATPSPGRPFAGGQAPGVAAQPVGTTIVAFQDATFTVVASGEGPFSYQWRFQGANVPDATNATLRLTNVQPAQAGDYLVVVLNSAGTIASASATLNVLIPADIVVQPRSQNIRITSNVTFTVTAISTTPMNYQWRFEGNPIPGATNLALTITNLQIWHQGLYSVVITDGVGPVASQPALLNVLINPVITRQPQSTVAVQGDNVTFYVGATANPFPIGFRWRKNGASLTNYSVNDFTNSFTLTNVQPSQGGRYTVVIANLANPTGILSSNATLTVLADTDGDHIPDEYETAERGLDPANPNDAGLDFDGDGFTNLQEYHAGTDPKDARSSLKVDSVTSSQGSTTISFLAASNRNYTVQFKESPTEGLWIGLADVTAAASNRIATVLDPYPASAERLYRLVSPVQVPARPGPMVLTSPRSGSLYAGSDLSLSVFATGKPPLSYQWLVADQPIPGATNATLTIPNLQPVHSGDYTVAITDGIGSTRSQPATIIVLVQPTITRSPESRTARAGETVVLSVEANGIEPLLYRWLYNNRIIAGARESTLTLPNISPAQAGDYSVVVRHVTPSGPASVVSAPATITVLP